MLLLLIPVLTAHAAPTVLTVPDPVELQVDWSGQAVPIVLQTPGLAVGSVRLVNVQRDGQFQSERGGFTVWMGCSPRSSRWPRFTRLWPRAGPLCAICSSL